MLVVRSVTLNDIDAVFELAKQSQGKLTSLPIDKAVITHKVKRAVQSTAKQVTHPTDELYFFVMEDLSENKIVGCCAIDAVVGINEPTYAYHVAKLKSISHQLNHQHTMRILELNNDFDGAAELCTLYLLPDYRQHDYGTWLSLTRLMFIACFQERFPKLLFAEIRGAVDSNDQTPFWTHVGSKFFPLDFATADKLTGSDQKQFIAELMPKFPLYIDLLPEPAQQTIGKPHAGSVAAMQILLNEGFFYRDYVDIFDAGPMIEAFASSVKTVRESKIMTIKEISEKKHTDTRLLANRQLDYRVVLAGVTIIDETHISLNAETAKTLQVQVGATIRCRNWEDD